MCDDVYLVFTSHHIISSLFSTAAVNSDLFPQAVGELLGAGCFITTVVVASITIFSTVPVQPTRRPFLRDVAFYLGGVLLVFFVFFDHKVQLYEGIMLIIYYFM
jgi:Ca2+/Na+ antiporter